MTKLRADLHVHTNYSDGLISPLDVLKNAEAAGLDLIAVTDHDGALAYAEIANSSGVKVVCGTEISAYLNGVKIHMLGYNFDPECGAFSNFFRELCEGSVARCEDVLIKLNKNGVKLTFDEVLKKRAHPEAPVHSMYIARAAAEKGWCGGNPFRFYGEYLAAGKCAYSDKCRPSPERAVEVINASGGFASLAHPARIEMPKEDLRALVKNLKAKGLAGIEAVYSTHTVIQTAYYKEMASAFDLIVTGGSDAHFNGGSKRIGSPEFFVGGLLAEKLGF